MERSEMSEKFSRYSGAKISAISSVSALPLFAQNKQSLTRKPGNVRK